MNGVAPILDAVELFFPVRLVPLVVVRRVAHFEHRMALRHQPGANGRGDFANRARIEVVELYPLYFALRGSCLNSNFHDTLSVSLAAANCRSALLLLEGSNVDASAAA